MIARIVAAALCFASLITSPVLAASARGWKVLVVLDSADLESKYSTFLGDLRDRGFDLTINGASDENALVRYEERVYDHLLLMAPSSSAFGGGLSVASIIDFQKRGGSVLVTASLGISEFVRDIAIEYSVEFDEKGCAVKDPLHTFPGDDELIVTTRDFVGNDVALPASVKKGSPVLFRGVGHRLTGKNKLITPLLTGSEASYSAPLSLKGQVDKMNLVGANNVFVSALQARNNARIVFAGSIDLFSDDFIHEKKIDGKSTGNHGFVTEVAKWVLQEKGVLSALDSRHHREGQDQQHGAYRIKDDMIFDIEISEFHDDAWHPFSPTDMQFEAVMLDPYLRVNMTAHSKSHSATTMRAVFRLPDVYGVFTFKVDYRRHGRSWLTHKETVAVHPFRHNEYPRFITAAFPYYVNSFSMIASFFALTVIVLYHGELGSGGKKKVKAADDAEDAPGQRSPTPLPIRDPESEGMTTEAANDQQDQQPAMDEDEQLADAVGTADAVAPPQPQPQPGDPAIPLADLIQLSADTLQPSNGEIRTPLDHALSRIAAGEEEPGPWLAPLYNSPIGATHVLVVNESQVLFVHAPVLARRSDFFSGLLLGGFAEAERLVVHAELPFADASAEVALRWFYSEVLPEKAAWSDGIRIMANGQYLGCEDLVETTAHLILARWDELMRDELTKGVPSGVLLEVAKVLAARAQGDLLKQLKVLTHIGGHLEGEGEVALWRALIDESVVDPKAGGYNLTEKSLMKIMVKRRGRDMLRHIRFTFNIISSLQLDEAKCVGLMETIWDEDFDIFFRPSAFEIAAVGTWKFKEVKQKTWFNIGTYDW
ncbi:hypothetical protein HK101_006177 [Irineochytrium annulatum]|nr:hypothetical protein HK101_006177 [Irineochytrium annulatum]